MDLTGLDPSACGRRNFLTAARGSIESIPIRFFGGGAAASVAGEWDGPALGVPHPTMGVRIDRHGTLPADDKGALALINALLPAGMPDLTEDDCHIHYCEAASNSLIPDRFGFLDSTTLRNIATGGDRGISFMNSHRTGDLSTPSELPFGKTFVGQYEQSLGVEGRILERTLLGFYMLKGSLPNGANGPTTDEIDKQIRGGVLKDVSVGLYPGISGKVKCNVCEQNYRQCRHYAGTTSNMEAEDIDGSRAVYGVPTGVATYTLVNWEIGEVSGVFDGAIPGAGFSKGYDEFRAGRFSPDCAAQFEAAYHQLLRYAGAKGAGATWT